jgi:hypothetical protein
VRLGSRYRSGRSPDWLKFKNPLGGLHVKTRILALALALAMPASAASAATINIGYSGVTTSSLIIAAI